MKLIYFSEQTMPKMLGAGSNKKARIAFGKKGMIQFNQLACERLGLKHGHKITIAQDETAPENWYVFRDDNHGFEVRTLSDKKSVGFNHSTLVASFRESMELPDDKTHNFLIAEQPTTVNGDKTKYWGILIPA